MKRGGIIIAHNSRDVDYALLAVISAGLAKKNLKIPFSLITDQSTLEWINKSNIQEKINSVFENVILTERPSLNNFRNLNDGSESKNVPFLNSTRSTVYDLTPYDETLLIDSDYLTLSNRLNQFWGIGAGVKLGSKINEISGTRVGYLDKNVSDVGVHLYWATTVMFKKDYESKTFFDLLKNIQENYSVYADIYRFNNSQYRNDIAFSIAKHIIDGFTTDLENSLPPILTVYDRDLLIDVKDERFYMLISETYDDSKFIACSTKGQDIHLMNKQSIIRNKEKLLGML